MDIYVLTPDINNKHSYMALRFEVLYTAWRRIHYRFGKSATEWTFKIVIPWRIIRVNI